MTDKIAARVIPWESQEGLWGIAVDLGNGRHLAYEVGPRAVAELDCARIERGECPVWGPYAGQVMRARH